LGLFLPLLLAAAALAGPVTVQDDRGVAISLEQPAQRIVSLAPFITELVYTAGGGDRLIAVSEHSDFPPAARELPRVSNAFNVNLEELLALRPDVVMSWQSGIDPRVVDRLESIGVPVFVLEPATVGDVAGALVRIGRLVGSGDLARRRAESFQAALARMQAQYSSRETVRVFYQISQRPLMTLNGRHMVTAILEICGGSNVFAGLASIAPTVNREQVLARDPEAILISASGGIAPDSVAFWSRYPAITAVSKSNLFVFDADTINRQTTRLVEGARRICTLLQRARRNLDAAD